MQRTPTDKEKFARSVIVLVDTREQRNEHILQHFNALGVQYEPCKLDFGDYSFRADGKDFRQSCAVERKGSVDELYGNITQDLTRIEKELQTAKLIAGGCTMLIEGVSNEQELLEAAVPNGQMLHQGRKVQEIGRVVYPVLQAWRAVSRYSLDVRFTAKENSAHRLLEVFYYHYRGYARMIAPRKENRQ